MLSFFICFFFNDTATTEIYTLSLHDALPILRAVGERDDVPEAVGMGVVLGAPNKERVQLVGSVVRVFRDERGARACELRQEVVPVPQEMALRSAIRVLAHQPPRCRTGARPSGRPPCSWPSGIQRSR